MFVYQAVGLLLHVCLLTVAPFTDMVYVTATGTDDKVEIRNIYPMKEFENNSSSPMPFLL